MAIRNLLKDTVVLIKKDGRRFENVGASVQGDYIFTSDPNLPIEEGDTFERKLASGLCEFFEVTDRGYFQGRGSIGSHFESKVCRVISSGAQQAEAGAKMLKLFVSHSSKDREVATLLVDLIRSALRLSANDIRCTSVDGYRLPGGADTMEQLRREVHDAQAFLGIISAASLDSLYVAFELGARWGVRKHLLPILVPGADARTLAGPLSGINALRCDNVAEMHQMLNELGKELSVVAEPASVYQRQIDLITEFSRRAAAQAAATISEAVQQSAERPAVSNLEAKILIAVDKKKDATAHDVAKALSLSDRTATFHLDEMARKNLVNWFGNTDPSIPARYLLAHEGRRFLVEQEKVGASQEIQPECKGDTFYFDGKGPFCTACWENNRKKISLKELMRDEQIVTGLKYACPICKSRHKGDSA